MTARKILYCGNSDFVVTTYVMGTHSQTMGRAVDVSKYLINALQTDPPNQISYIHGGQVMEEFPSSFDKLRAFDLLILSDIAADALLMYYPTIQDSPLPYGPNRLQLIKECVEDGMGFIMIGAYCSFAGYMGMGHYHKTPIEDILPVYILPYDDHVEVPQGFHLIPKVLDHPLTTGFPWDDDPFWLIGYNRVEPKPGKFVIAEFQNDPILMTSEYGKGKTIAFMAGATPHWGGDFHKWKYYSQFWTQAGRWCSKEGN